MVVAELVRGAFRAFAHDVGHPGHADAGVREQLADGVEVAGVVVGVAHEDETFDLGAGISHDRPRGFSVGLDGRLNDSVEHSPELA